MKPPSLRKMKISQLRHHLLEKRFAVPKLQRNFVWDARRAAKLLDSMYRGMPIGSLFLWEMDRKSANLIRQSAEVLPAFDGRQKHVWFVIDGQQRLSVIHQAFEAQARHNDAGREVDFGRLCFVVSPDNDQEDPPRIVYRRPAGKEFVPVRDILASDWRRRMPSKAAGFRKRIQGCRERLLSYPMPVVTVADATLEEIGEVFIRINSQGMRITSADRAIALMGKVDVRAMAQELRQKLRESGFALPGVDSILMGFNLVTEKPRPGGDPPKLEAMARRWSKRVDKDEGERDRFRKLWDRYQHAFRSAVDHLRHRFPVHDESYLPSANMLSTLAVFFYHHPGPPDRVQAAEIRKWFWATGIAQRYSGRGYHQNLAADAKFFRDLGIGKRRHFVFRDRLDPVQDLQSAEYTSRSARTRAFFCLLAAQKPRLLETGDEIRLEQESVSHANRRDRHHIFPKSQLRAHFLPRVYNSLCNICFLVSRDNNQISSRLPRFYLGNYRDNGKRQFRAVAKSHLIPVSDGDGVWDRGVVAAFKNFRQTRLETICGEFEKQAGLRLFRRT